MHELTVRRRVRFGPFEVDLRNRELRRQGAMHAPREVEQRVAAYCHQLGFELSRTRELDGVHVLEFYLNLYERPELGDTP